MAEDDTVLQFEYALNRDDYWRFNRYVLDRSPKFRAYRFLQRYFVFLAVLLSCAFIMRNQMARGVSSFLIGLAVALAFATVAGGLTHVLVRRGIRWRVMALPSAGGRMTASSTLAIGPDGIASRSALSEGRTAWAAIRQIAEDERHTDFVLDDPMAIVLPMRAFASADEYRAFVSAARAHWHRAIGAPAA